jgi:predicted transcriptional regulator|tara:strand:- start:57423 stop:57617 length:195 start_codon:yes stop_codon:yes gene_type:complete
MENGKKNRISVSLSDSDYRDLQAYAVARDLSISWVARRAIQNFIDRNPPEQTELPMHIEKFCDD